jgi:putative nucleotidyltransferase with HDIG domain
MENIRNILDKVDVLPLSPSLLPKLLPQLSDVNANFDEVVRIISLEQTLTAKLLQICNSAFFGQTEPVSTVADAVNRVGYQPIYLLAAMINGRNCFPSPSPKGIDAEKLWQHSVATAFNTKFAAESAGLDADLLLTAGLLHDIGKVVLAQANPQKGGAAFNSPSNATTLEWEHMTFGCTHAEVGASLLEKWKLPPDLIYGVRYHHDPHGAGRNEKIAACVTVGNIIAHSEDHPKLTDTPEFTTAMSILRLDGSHVKHWQQQFADAHVLIAGMSRLPP